MLPITRNVVQYIILLELLLLLFLILVLSYIHFGITIRKLKCVLVVSTVVSHFLYS